MLFTYLSLKEKGGRDLAFELLPLQLETLCSIFFIVFITEYVVPAWVYQDHILVLLCFYGSWHLPMIYTQILFLQQNFSFVLHSLLFILSSELLKFIVSDLALYLLASLFGNS